MATDQWVQGVRGSFANPSKWNRGKVPVAADSVFIKVAGAYTVASASDETIHDLTLANATLKLTGGTFNVTGEGTDELNVAVSSEIDIDAGATMKLTDGNMTLDGTINIAPNGKLQIEPTQTQSYTMSNLSGEGTIVLGGSGSELDFPDYGGVTSTCTIEGGGLISTYGTENSHLSLINNGTIDANMSSTELQIVGGRPPDGGPERPVDNNYGTYEATNGATLDIFADAVGNGPTGIIEAIGPGSVVELDVTFVSSGTLLTSAGGRIEVNGLTTLSGVTAGNDGGNLINRAAIYLQSGASLVFQGNIENFGSISFTPSDTANLYLNGNTVLAGDGTLTLSDNAMNVIQPFFKRTTLINSDNTISGSGTFIGSDLSGGAHNHANTHLQVINSGLIDADGTNALIFNAVKVTNGSEGLLEGSGSGGLSLQAGTFKNSGMVEALDGSSVSMDSAVALSNNTNGVLNGGTWIATDNGNGASLILSGPAITDDNARICLTGSDAEFLVGTTALEDSLTTIGSKGRLELLGNRSWTSSNSVADDGLLQLQGGTFESGALTVASSGLVSGFGTVDDSITNDGQIAAKGGVLAVTGSIAGSGNATIYAHSTLEIDGLADTGTVTFNGKQTTLAMDDPSAFNGTIANWSFTDTIDLANTQATSATIANDKLTVNLADHTVLQFALSNPPADTTVNLADDHHGGVSLTLQKAMMAAGAHST